MPEIATPFLLPPERLEPFVGDRHDWERLQRGQGRLSQLLAGQALFNVSSRVRAGGLSALIRSHVAYARGAGIDAHWHVIDRSPEFLALAKRIHNKLHGLPDGGPFGEEARFLYEDGMEQAARDLVERIRHGDVVILNDPQTAGLVGVARRAGARVIWRCHVGLDTPNQAAREAWSFLDPYVAEADAYVFSRGRFLWENLDPSRSFTIPPVINPVAPKNQELSQPTVSGILATIGIQPDGRTRSFVRLDGSPGRVDRPVALAGGPPLAPETPVVLQISAWNHLKDPAGVVRMFAELVAPRSQAHLIVAGPAVEGVPQETEAEAVYGETVATLHDLAPEVRARVHVVAIPNDDPEEGDAIVNALQRRATVVVQRSHGEGFGLAVMEAMWKSRPVVCSRVGGLQEQVVDGESGFLIEPEDSAGAAEAILKLLEDPETVAAMGTAGHQHVAQRFLLPHDLPRWGEVIEYVLAQPAEPQRV